MRLAIEDSPSTHTVGNDNKEGKHEVTARWSFNAGRLADDDDEDDWGNTSRIHLMQQQMVSMVEEEDPNVNWSQSLDDLSLTGNDDGSLSFGEPSPVTPRKGIKKTPKLKMEKQIFTPEQVSPRKIRKEIKSKNGSTMERRPADSSTMLSAENCFKEFQEMSLEASDHSQHSTFTPKVTRKKWIPSPKRLSLSANPRNRASLSSVRQAMQKRESERLFNKNSIQDSLRNVDFDFEDP